MKPAVVVDIGNTRIKWGRCTADIVDAVASLPPEEPASWAAQVECWNLPTSTLWVLTGVHPQRLEHLATWIRERGDTVRFLRREDLPLPIAVDNPERVGIDRLLNAVAANRRRGADEAAILVDVGSAITVDRVGRDGTFRGGAILPGFRLMAQSLHDSTALLPLVEWPFRPPALPATNTTTAIQAGIYHAVVGGIVDLIRGMTDHQGRKNALHVYLTGGDGPDLRWALIQRLPDELHVEAWPEMTLEGVRVAAEALP